MESCVQCCPARFGKLNSNALPGYFFILLKLSAVIGTSFLVSRILLANRFNRPYYRVLITGNWSGGETSSG
jgi:hypothetical protein